MMRKLKGKKLSLSELNRLAEAWSKDPEIARKTCSFLQQFGPSGSDLVHDFFKWVKKEHRASVKCHQTETPDGEACRIDYYASFTNEEDELEFTLKFR